MKAIVAMDQAAGASGLKLVEKAEPQAAINDVVVGIHAAGWVSTELEWPSTWTGRAQLSEIVQRVRDGRLHTNIGTTVSFDDAVATFNSTDRRKGKTIIRLRP